MTTTTVSPVQRADLTGSWDIDPAHSRLGFATKHAMVATVRGAFTDFTGTLELDAADPATSRAEVVVRTASLDSGNSDRDQHVRSADFLDVEQHPTMTFVSTRVEPVADDRYRMWGGLTIRGVTREVQLDLEYDGTTVDPWGNLRAGFSGETTVSRKEWGLTWNVALEAGGFLVADKVKLALDVSAVKRA